MEESKKRIADLFSSEKEKRPAIISKIKEGHNVLTGLDFLWYENARAAIHSLVNEKSISETKNYFYICGLLDECMIDKFGSRILDYGVNHISYALLSDNKLLMDRYALLTHKHFEFITKQGSLVHAIQCIIKDDIASLEKDIVTYEHVTTTKRGQLVKPDLLFFKGMLSKNEAQIIQAIQQLLKDHKKRNKYLGLAADFISIPALGYTKLAWLKGIEVDIDHPLIPKELLPYRPLEKYTDSYDFLKEL